MRHHQENYLSSTALTRQPIVPEMIISDDKQDTQLVASTSPKTPSQVTNEVNIKEARYIKFQSATWCPNYRFSACYHPSATRPKVEPLNRTNARSRLGSAGWRYDHRCTKIWTLPELNSAEYPRAGSNPGRQFCKNSCWLRNHYDATAIFRP